MKSRVAPSVRKGYFSDMGLIGELDEAELEELRAHAREALPGVCTVEARELLHLILWYRPGKAPLSKVSRWLERLPGARLIIESNSVELCARYVRGLDRDESRYVSRDNVGEPMRDAVLSELVDEMAVWEANGWEYEQSDFVRDLLDAEGD